MNHSFKHWVEVEKYNIFYQKPMPVGHYVDDIATQYIGFKQAQLPTRKNK